MKKIKILNLILILALGYSCGKKIEENEPNSTDSGNTAPNGERNSNENRAILNSEFIQKQKLVCEDPLFCPANIAKLVIMEGNEVRFCTGTLVTKNKMITSSSCLPRALKIPKIDCSRNIFAVFPKNVYGVAEKVACKKIEYIDQNSYKEPALWKSDIAIIELYEDLSRPHANFSDEGVLDNEEFITWKVDYISDYAGVLKKDKCHSILNTYLNPFSSNQHSPMFVSTSCAMSEGNMGAPLMKRDKIVGVYSKEMSPRIYNYLESSGLLLDKLDRYFHFSNMACTRAANDLVSTELPAECLVNTSVSQLDQRRSKILRSSEIHQDTMNEVEQEIEIPNKYFVWDVKFHSNRNLTAFEAHLGRPKCVFKSMDWIGEFRRRRNIYYTYGRIKFETPYYIFKTKLNKYLRALSVLESSETKSYQIEFNPHGAHFKNSTYVTITSELLGEQSKVTYDGVTAVCP